MRLEIKIPSVGESVTEIVIAQWLKKDGEYVTVDEPICQIESDKATMDIPAEEAGVLTIKANEGDTMAVGDVIGIIDTEAPAPEKTITTDEESDTETELLPDEPIRISPVAAKILDDAGIAPQHITGTGPDGRIVKEDALKAVQSHPQEESETAARKKASGPVISLSPNVDLTSTRKERRVPMSTLRKTIARRLVESKNQTAMLTTFNEIDMSALMAIRTKYRDIFIEKYDVKLGFMSLFTRSVCLALDEVPVINAQIDENDIIFHDYCDISIAVSTPRGLVTPVMRNAENMTIAELEKEIGRLAERARDGKLTVDEMTGGTFTITNGGVFGSLLSTPIINIPQSAILGMHTIQDRPVARQGEVVIRPMMYVALSYDHRIIDGKESVTFLVRVKELLEDPTRILLMV